MKKLKGLIYCRVSSNRQVAEGNGLSSQEQACRNYAKNILGIEIERTFNEEGVSGGLFERKSIQELFGYIDSHKEESYIVIFEDLNRLSRDIQVHGLLRAEFKKRGVELACPNFQFDETPEGNFKENISVVVSEYERKKNRQRVIDRQQMRLEQGFWCFPLPIGYKYAKAPSGGKIVVKDDNYKIVKKILENYADRRIESINDIIKVFHSKGVKIGNLVNGKVYNANLAQRMLRNILYTGHLEYPSKNVSLRKAQHEALISMETFEKIQKRLTESPQYITSRINENLNRKDLNEDFPLRGFLHCKDSGYMLSGAWSQGKQKKYPYYCFTKHSPNRGKSINRKVMHEDFERLLSSIQLDTYFIEAFKKNYKEILASKSTELSEFKDREKKKIQLIDSKIQRYVTRIGKTESDSIISSYENEIIKLEKEKSDIYENITFLGDTGKKSSNTTRTKT